MNSFFDSKCLRLFYQICLLQNQASTNFLSQSLNFSHCHYDRIYFPSFKYFDFHQSYHLLASFEVDFPTLFFEAKLFFIDCYSFKKLSQEFVNTYLLYHFCLNFQLKSHRLESLEVNLLFSFSSFLFSY